MEATPASVLLPLENRKFSDYSNAYIPEITEHLTAARSGWLALWTKNTELGRPIYQISGFGSAYPPSWIIGKLVDQPWRFLTTVSLSFCFMAGLFVLLFARERGLAPVAGLVAGTSLATSPLLMYWLTFPMFPAVWCWSAGALWAVTRLARRPDLVGWGALAFSGYSLLMTAYPQPVVFHAYLLGGYGVYLVHRQVRNGRGAVLTFVALASSALLVGAALTFPVYRDLALLASESARVAPDPAFFTVVLPTLNDLAELMRLVVLGTVPEIFGHPVTPSFPLAYAGLSVTLVVVFFGAVALLTRLRTTWGWWLAIVILCLLAFVHPLYAFGVQHLGFHLSRSTPLGSILLPLTVITAYGVDAMVKRPPHEPRSRAALVAGALTLAVISFGVAYAAAQQLSIRWGVVTGMLAVAALLVSLYLRFRPILVMLALASVIAMTSYPLMLKQDAAQIVTSSPLVDKVRDHLPPGSRYAVVEPGVSVLPPNLNASVGLASVHSYNSLSPTRYHALIRALGGQVQTYGRSNTAIAPDYSAAMFWMSNIGLILSPRQLVHDNLAPLGESSGVRLYQVVSRMGEALQVFPPRLDGEANAWRIPDPRSLPRHAPNKLLDRGDVLEFEVTPSVPSVLLLSQKFHRDWHARVYNRGGWRSAQTAEINGIFQGVILPSETFRVRLDFKPFARHAWLAHAFWFYCSCWRASGSGRHIDNKLWKAHEKGEPHHPIQLASHDRQRALLHCRGPFQWQSGR
ncbi:hypothetical protein [Hydrogenophaga sp. NH-16]|uniref:hypothetical protein n=1 Tax=Hydrogenophaga sp. NH-16 TaxID=2184519 RepID=UPI000FDABFF3|nr:hypothetical protein [Hydrogenophaga sp. NH-16]